MSKSKYKYRVYNGKVIKSIIENSRIYFLAAFFAFGVIIGSAIIKSDLAVASKISVLVDSYTDLKAGQGIVEIFCNSFSVGAIFIGASVFLGFSLIGYPLIIWLPFLRGMGFGAVCGYLYSTYRLAGLGYSILIIYPGAIVSTFAFLLACNDCCEYSKNAYLKSISGKGQFSKNETKVFLTRQLFYLVFCFASAFIDAILSLAFLRFFEI